MTLTPIAPTTVAFDARVNRLLDLARQHLGMDVAWLSDFTGDRQRVRAATGDLASFPSLAPGCDWALEDSYCVRVLAGGLPPVVAETRRHPVTSELGVTSDLGIGAYVGVPVRGSDGSPLGMLCCVSSDGRPALDTDAADFLGLVVALLADDTAGWAADQEFARRRTRADVERMLEAVDLVAAYQPIVSLTENKVIGYEALARSTDPGFSPAEFFTRAASAGLGLEAELHAVGAALTKLDDLPAGAWLAVNVSPAALVDPRMRSVLAFHGGRLAVEITEHSRVGDYDELARVTTDLQAAGVLIAVDDAGAGYASLQHILRLRPDIIKLDIEITRDIHLDPVKQALARSLVGFADSLGATLLAEGVETADELDALIGLGVDAAQGFLLGRPAALDAPVYIPSKPVRSRDSDAAIDRLLNATALGSAEMAEAALRAILDATGLQSAAVKRYDGSLHVRASGRDAGDATLALSWPDDLAEHCLASDINWTSDLPSLMPDVTDGSGPVQTFLCLPLRSADGTVEGTLCGASSQRRSIGSGVMVLLRAYARLLSTGRLAGADGSAEAGARVGR